ncbi:hypothetical protein P3342_002114 [Pyrenophora teres f. teres]|nr:hypothetical protein P3342_002114 [Pyrenophora teres f. teres]
MISVVWRRILEEKDGIYLTQPIPRIHLSHRPSLIHIPKILIQFIQHHSRTTRIYQPFRSTLFTRRNHILRSINVHSVKEILATTTVPLGAQDKGAYSVDYNGGPGFTEYIAKRGDVKDVAADVAYAVREGGAAEGWGIEVDGGYVISFGGEERGDYGGAYETAAACY